MRTLRPGTTARALAVAASLATAMVTMAVPARGETVADSDASTRNKLKALFRSGKAHYNLGEYREAVEDFKDAYRLTPDPVFLFNIAQSQREMGDHEAALRSFQNFLKEATAPRDRADAQRLIAEEEKTIAARRAQVAAAARVGLPPPPAPSPVEPLPVADHGGHRSRKATWIALGVTGGVLLAGGAVTLGILLTRPSPPDAPFGTFAADFR